jgi:mRNA interferase RelE/StbE
MIDSLEEDPRPPQIRKLAGTKDEWRIRIGDYRILLEIDDRNKTVVIYRILHRKEAYKK